MKSITETMNSIAKAMESANMSVPEELLEEKYSINQVPLTDKEINKAFEGVLTVKKINKLAKEAILATGNSDAYSTGMCNGIEYMRACLTNDEPNFLECSEKKSNINPDHYKNSTSLECIEAMELVFGNIAVIDFCMCNAWKYIWRWKHKNGVEDLEKAKWYIKKAAELDLDPASYYSVMLERMKNYIEVNNCSEQDGDK